MLFSPFSTLIESIPKSILAYLNIISDLQLDLLILYIKIDRMRIHTVQYVKI
ncbi:protein of unknown function [Acetoanaerobium sticklandii]|uniref:Uncharacterized protein n=1 Tax=Acetoanaerobium sticklandii (strain ATCC 12662 / DSM 519 / JCM 1433 / CCUG 9281 / NCIMB 10654 / HF) TaxID=499177 RepID=E3PR26_ACESD|nr:protein of unknown function [Acetoanaerobium sticklandii]